MKSSLCVLLELINPMFGNFNCMTAEPTSLGLSVIVAGAIAFAIWFLRKTRLKRGKAERKRRLEIAR